MIFQSDKMPLISLIIRISLILFAGFTFYEVRQTEFFKNLISYQSPVSERKLIHAKSDEIPVVYQGNHSFDVPNECPSLKLQEIPFPLQNNQTNLETRSLQVVNVNTDYCRSYFPRWYTKQRYHTPLKFSTEPANTPCKALSVYVKPSTTYYLKELAVFAVFALMMAGLCIYLPTKFYKKEKVEYEKVYKVDYKKTNATIQKKKVCRFPVVSNRYKIISILGEGGFANVYQALDRKTSKNVAVKCVELKSSNLESYVVLEVFEEAFIMRKLKHPNVMGLISSFVKGNNFFMLMEMMESSLSILNGNTNLTQNYIAVIFKELLKGLDYIHKQGIIHRDIKSANILINKKGKIKICDFGMAIMLTDVEEEFGGCIGTSGWMAPEVIKRDVYDQRVDIWSLGMILVELIDGKPSYSDLGDEEAKKLIVERGFECKKKDQYIDTPVFDFLHTTLTYNQFTRPFAATLLKHPFLQGTPPFSSLVPFLKLIDFKTNAKK